MVDDNWPSSSTIFGMGELRGMQSSLAHDCGWPAFRWRHSSAELTNWSRAVGAVVACDYRPPLGRSSSKKVPAGGLRWFLSLVVVDIKGMVERMTAQDNDLYSPNARCYNRV